jgi:hypothetical protein
MRARGLAAATVALTQSACFLLDVKHVVDDVTYSSGEGKPLAVQRDRGSAWQWGAG